MPTAPANIWASAASPSPGCERFNGGAARTRGDRTAMRLAQEGSRAYIAALTR